MTNSISPHPQWALAHKKPGTELRRINGNYYLYEYKTIYNSVKKRAKKITGSIIGSITEQEGLIPSSKRALKDALIQKSYSSIRCKEYGMPFLISTQLMHFSTQLEKFFGVEWKNIIAIAYCRFVFRCPLKSIPFRLASSYLPELLQIEPFNEKQASALLNWIGGQEEKRLQYMKSFISSDDYILIDSTNVLSHSSLIPAAKVGYSHTHHFDSQFNLMYIYSVTSQLPVYYRLLPGNIREVKAFKNSLLEAGLRNAIVVADKGFYSQANVDLLQQEQLSYILPLKRDNSIIDYAAIKSNEFKGSGNFFHHEKRAIWHNIYTINENTTIYLFLDETLRVKEETDYLFRIKTHPENHAIEVFHRKKNHFGTIALLSNLQDTPEEIYMTYKSRLTIEILFDGMKNVLDADHTYMQNEQTLQGWMFVNHICLQWYQHLYLQLKQKQILKKISVNDYIQLLTDIKKIWINGNWHFNEFTKQTQKLIEVLGVKL